MVGDSISIEGYEFIKFFVASNMYVKILTVILFAEGFFFSGKMILLIFFSTNSNPLFISETGSEIRCVGMTIFGFSFLMISFSIFMLSDFDFGMGRKRMSIFPISLS